MISKRTLLLLLFTAAILSGVPFASATSEAMTAFNENYSTNDTRLATCTVCHGSEVESLNAYGLAYQENEGDFASIEPIDSDGDDFTNIDEIQSLTFPGDPEDYPGNMSEDGNLTERVSNASEKVSNASEKVSNASEKVSNASEKVSNVTGKISDVTDGEAGTEEPATDSGQQIPGFEAIFAVTGMLMAIYLLKRK